MYIENIIVGAGPSGLAMAGRFAKAGLEYLLLEQANTVAPKWHQHYDRLHLHTVKQLSSLPYLDFPEEYPQYVSKFQLIDYYNDYIKQLNIQPSFNTIVQEIKKGAEHWQLTCANNVSYTAKNVIIATGLNRVPTVPYWKGLESFKGEIIHASKYKNAQAFLGKKVLVIGMGNTGAELALDLAEHKIDVSISVRSELVIIPREMFGRAVQLTAVKLNKLPFGLGDWLGSLSSKIAFGNLHKYGLPISNISPAVLRRVHGRTPTIDIGTVAKIKSGDIKVRKGIAEIIENAVKFENGLTDKFDVLLMATGYTASTNDFLKTDADTFIEKGEPCIKIGVDANAGLFFIGYDKYTYGGTLGTLKAESEMMLNEINRFK